MSFILIMLFMIFYGKLIFLFIIKSIKIQIIFNHQVKYSLKINTKYFLYIKISLASILSFNNGDIFEFYLILLWKIHAHIHNKKWLYLQSSWSSTLLLIYIKKLYRIRMWINVSTTAGGKIIWGSRRMRKIKKEMKTQLETCKYITSRFSIDASSRQRAESNFIIYWKIITSDVLSL